MVDLVELLAEQCNELVFIFVSPSAIVVVHAILDLLFDLRVLKILVSPFRVERCLDGPAELHDDERSLIVGRRMRYGGWWMAEHFGN